MIGRTSFSVALQHIGAAERARAELVTGNFFQALGVKPLIGRTSRRTTTARQALIPSRCFAQFLGRQFGASPAILNQTVRVNGHPMTIVGVTPPRFIGLSPRRYPDIFVPVMMKKQITPTWDQLFDPQSSWLTVFARLKPGLTVEQAQPPSRPYFALCWTTSWTQEPRTFRRQVSRLEPPLEPAATGLSEMRGKWETPLIALAAMVGLVLLIACANVANLMITRAAGRHREIAMRASLGARRLVIVRQLLSKAW